MKTIFVPIFVASMMYVAYSCLMDIRRWNRQEFKECVGDQIEVARQNWDTVKSNDEDDSEFVAQDQLRDFVMSVCYNG